jgi:site-specific recombinase XerD
MSIVQKILGHENIRTTQQYAKVLNKTISDEVLNAFNQINNGK